MDAPTAQAADAGTKVDLVGHYKHLLQARDQKPGADGAEMPGPLEGAADQGPDLSEPAISDRLDSTAAQLHQIVKEEFGDKQELHDIVDEIVRRGDEALRTLGGEDEEELLADPETVHTLEVIVRTDGSRPSFLIRDGDVVRSSSPLGTWGDELDDSAEPLRKAIACVGRIDVPELQVGFGGTGFLVHPNLILTNRHVLEVAARPNADGTWTFKPDVAIDFGHEFGSDKPSIRRPLKRVVYAGAKQILGFPIDHRKLDLALIELEPATAGEAPATVLEIDGTPAWAQTDQILFCIGYPADPGDKEKRSLLEELFRLTWGNKRLAPGLVMTSSQSVQPWTATHDTTTLGGNSGSVMLVAGRERLAAGLHYGGSRGDPRENWGHILGATLATADPNSGRTLKEHLADFDVQAIDPVLGEPV